MTRINNDIVAFQIAHYHMEMEAIYRDMDRKFSETATSYGFVCRGCDENCCRTKFYHHTHLEYFHLAKGFHLLAPETRDAVYTLAETAVRSPNKEAGSAISSMCPLNMDEKCLLYAYRPMICRLHGIPHELRRPGGGEPNYGPGCNDFDRQRRQENYIPFDRTPFYMQLAGLEKDCREKLSLPGKIKLTVAEMIIRFGDPQSFALVPGQ